MSRAPSADAGARLCGPPPRSAVRHTCRRRRRTARPPALVLGSRVPLRRSGSGQRRVRRRDLGSRDLRPSVHLPACGGLVLRRHSLVPALEGTSSQGPFRESYCRPYSNSLVPGGLLGFSSAARGQFECALQRSQRDVPPRLHKPFRDVEIVGDLRRRPTWVVRAARTRAAFSSSGSPRSGAFQVSARCMKWISLVGSE